MPEYTVRWVIDVEADSPKEAAETAFSIQQDPDNIGSNFDVVDSKTGEAVTVDLRFADQSARVTDSAGNVTDWPL